MENKTTQNIQDDKLDLLNTIKLQKENLNLLETAIIEIKNDNITKERDSLKNKSKELQIKIEKLNYELNEVKAQKALLQDKLFDIFYDSKEKDILNSTIKKFKLKEKSLLDYEKELYFLEKNFISNLKEKFNAITQENTEEYLLLYNNFQDVEKQLIDYIETQKIKAQKISKSLDEDI